MSLTATSPLTVTSSLTLRISWNYWQQPTWAANQNNHRLINIMQHDNDVENCHRWKHRYHRCPALSLMLLMFLFWMLTIANRKTRRFIVVPHDITDITDINIVDVVAIKIHRCRERKQDNTKNKNKTKKNERKNYYNLK